MAKVALITGATRGIGKAIALRLARDGFDIAVNCRNPEAGEAVAAQCRGLGVNAQPFVADVSDYEACGALVKAVVERMGSLDVLVNNAGITKDGLLARMKEENFDAVISTNLKSVFNLCRHASAVMMRQRGGRIVNISSVVGLYGNGGQVNYAASKAGVVGITLSAAKELGGRSITVNAVAPGFIETDMTNALGQETREAMLQAIALKRFGKPEEVAAAVSFLAGEDAGYITGQVLVVDGGISM